MHASVFIRSTGGPHPPVLRLSGSAFIPAWRARHCHQSTFRCPGLGGEISEHSLGLEFELLGCQRSGILRI